MTEQDDNHQRYESFTRLFLHNEGKVRAFVRAMMTSDVAVDDVDQEVAIVVWR
jgi:DNA-directed RNA polymerase specialized sigma24 family protein